VCLLHGTSWIFKYTFCSHSVFMCFMWISEQTAIISLYSTNWQVFTTETECVYCAVRAESLNIRSAHTVYLCVLCGSQNKQRLFPYTALTDRFLQPRRSVYCAVRAESLNIIQVNTDLVHRVSTPSVQSVPTTQVALSAYHSAFLKLPSKFPSKRSRLSIITISS
jgi:hypothetical protein